MAESNKDKIQIVLSEQFNKYRYISFTFKKI